MATNQQLNFLQEKIQEIGSAILFNLSDSVLKFPTSIVTSLRVDDFGYVWFFVQKPKQNLKEFESEFPVRLDFFRKGKNYFLQVTGKAWVVNDPEDMNSLAILPDGTTEQLFNEMVLVKVKMMKAEYYETKTNSSSWWQVAANMITTWFRTPNQVRPDIYYPAS